MAPSTASSASVLAAAMLQPTQLEQRAPCCAACISGGDIRAWIGVVAQREKLGLSADEACARAWRILAAVNPFPATLGRVCPHPCEAQCNRAGTDGAVAINALERFLGDWALAHRLSLPVLAERGSASESIGVVGAGPAGLSFAFQMARRGYPVTVYEKEQRAGGMLQYGIPEYRLPDNVLAAEIDRILAVGVEMRLNTAVGHDVSVAQLRERHAILFLGIGARRGLTLGIRGEEGPGSWTGTAYLARVNRGEPVRLGQRVIVVGGGNTAIDAARTARRAGASVVILYRRSRAEMPAIAAEVDDAMSEGIAIEFLTAPVEVRRQEGVVRSVAVQRMVLGEPDASGRRRPVRDPGSEFELPADSVIAAISQQPDWDGLEQFQPRSPWITPTADGECDRSVWTGGDAQGLGLAGMAIGQGRRAAEAVHSRLRGLPLPHPDSRTPIAPATVKSDFYTPQKPVTPRQRPPSEALRSPDIEVRETISETEFLREVSRCYSCGLCFGCEQCFMYCNAGGFVARDHTAPGAYFGYQVDQCLSCGKCIDLCPCGFLSAT